MTNTTLWFIFGSLVTSAGFVLYIKNLRKYPDMHVSVISWLIWLSAEIENLVACFYNFKPEDWPRLVFCVITTAATVAILITAISRKMHSKFTGEDLILIIILGVGLYAIIYDKDNNYSSAFALIAIGTGYILTIRGVLREELHEKALPWLVVCLGAVITLATYLYMGVQGIVRNFAVITVMGEGGVYLAVTYRAYMLKKSVK